MPLLCCLCPPIPTMGELYCQQISSLSTLSACFYSSNIFSPVDATSMTLVLVILTSVVLSIWFYSSGALYFCASVSEILSWFQWTNDHYGCIRA